MTTEGGPIGARQADRAGRSALGAQRALFLGIAFWGIIFQRERRALDDLIAGTAVVYSWDARAARLRWMARTEGTLAPRAVPHQRPVERRTEPGAAALRPRSPRRRSGAPLRCRSMSFTEVTTPHPGVAVVTLNRPERMNAMAFDVMIPFRDALREVGTDNSVRIVVITGAGRGFCSGADHENPGSIPHIDGLTLPTIALRSMEMLDDVIGDHPAPAPAGDRRRQRRCHRRRLLPAPWRPTSASLSEDAYFRAAGINNGLTAAELGLSYLLPRSVGQSRATEIMLTGRDVDAAEAERIGIRVTGRARRRSCCPRASSWPTASTAGAGPASS